MNGDAIVNNDPLLKALALMPTLRDKVDAQHIDDGSGHCRACPRHNGRGFHPGPCAVQADRRPVALSEPAGGVGTDEPAEANCEATLPALYFRRGFHPLPATPHTATCLMLSTR